MKLSLSTADAMKRLKDNRTSGSTAPESGENRTGGKTDTAGTVIELDAQQLKALQDLLSGMLAEISEICEREGILFFLGGGSALGAYRDGRIIPWDDDVDIIMPRADYERFAEVFPGALGDRYVLHAPGRTKNYGLLFPRIRRKGTTVRTREDFANPDPGAFIDVCILENTYDLAPLRILHGIGCMAWGFLVSCRKFYRDREELSALAANAGDPGFAGAVRKKIALGRLISGVDIDSMTIAGDRWNKRCRSANSRYVAVPTGRQYFFGELYPRSTFYPARPCTFEGRKQYLPADAESYLKNLYGDYNSIPESGEREKHLFFAPFDLGES